MNENQAPTPDNRQKLGELCAKAMELVSRSNLDPGLAAMGFGMGIKALFNAIIQDEEMNDQTKDNLAAWFRAGLDQIIVAQPVEAGSLGDDDVAFKGVLTSAPGSDSQH